MRAFNRAACVLLSLAILFATPAFSAKKKKQAEAYGMIGVTVFRDPGFAAPGAELILSLDPVPGPAPVKHEQLTGHTDARGEFVFRVPTAAMRYKIRASLKGFVSQEKQVSIEGEQRMEVTFLLSAESK